MGQRVSENGNTIGSAFTIFSVGTHPDVVYNPQANEYLVVCSYNGINGQMISSTGNPISSSTQLMSDASWPHVEYNPISRFIFLLVLDLPKIHLHLDSIVS